MELVNAVIYVVCTTIRLLCYVLEGAIFLRAILSWFPISEDAWINRLLYAVTEPVLTPLRMLFARFRWFENLPVDITPLFAMLLFSLLGAVLPIIPYS